MPSPEDIVLKSILIDGLGPSLCYAVFKVQIMRTNSQSYHVLEIRRQKQSGDEWGLWAKPLAAMFRPAEMLAYHGRISEAIECAERIQIENYGGMQGMQIRCVTKTTTVTATVLLADDGMAIG